MVTEMALSSKMNVDERLSPLVMVVVLNWNGLNETRHCLDALEKVTYPRVEIIVVDNGSTDGSVDALRAEYPQVTLLPLSENVGFAGGSNHGLRYALRRGADYVLLLNNDARIAPDAVDVLVQAAQADQQIGILGPVIYRDDDLQHIESAGGWFNLYTGRFRHFETLPVNQLCPYEVDMLSGCAMMVRREVIEQVGLLNECYFAYLEDAEWCVRVHRADYRVVAVPGAQVWHRGSAASGGSRAPLRIYYSVRNQLLMVNTQAPARHRLHRTWRDVWIIALNLGYVMVGPVVKSAGLRALVWGIRDYYRGRFGRWKVQSSN
jgi:GT2 family glycosyltransferase